MSSSPSIKVVIIQSVLRGSGNSTILQEVATVHINDRELRVYAPPTASGKAIDWAPHFTARRQGGYFSEEDLQDQHKAWAIKAAKEALESEARDKSLAEGMHPDGIHCSAQVCKQGHIQHCDGMPFEAGAHCTKCGSSCIHECPHCKEPIHGAQAYGDTSLYVLPNFCHGCGRAYPWMEDKLQTARRLLDHDERLSYEDREELWSDLQYVMSDPKAPLVAAKKKLIEINLGKAGAVVKDVFTDIVAKTTAEMFKP
ncbi:MAG: DUF2321 domain-containing protein [Terracidiphilus sp.]